MKKILILIALTLGTCACFAQMNRIINDEEKGEILFGFCTREAISNPDICAWFLPEYESYTVKSELFNETFTAKFDSVYVFFGTWCEDSKREVPRFCKIFDHEYFKGVPLTFICVNSKKKVDVVDVDDYYVQYVPTMIFYKKGEELCRIIEQPRTESLESDIMDLLERIQE